MNPLTILQVVEPGKDGVFRHVEGLVDFLLERKHRVCLAYSEVRGSDRLLHLVDRVRESGGGTVNLKVDNIPQPADAQAMIGIWKLISQFRPQVGHAHSSKAGILLRSLSTFVGLPAFYTPHAYYGMRGKGGLRDAAFNSIEAIFGRIGTTINVSHDEAVFAREKLKIAGTKQVIVPNAIDTERFRNGTPEEKRDWRREMGLAEDAVILGSLGRLSFQKDPATLYKAFTRVAERHPKLVLVHVGEGEIPAECAQAVAPLLQAKRILRIKYLQSPNSFYHAADGFILSSIYEGLSFAVLEALASDLPLLLTDVPGNRDFLRLGLSHVWSSPSGNMEKLSECIEAWLQDRNAERARNHRRIAKEQFSLEACYGRILELYNLAAAARAN